MPGEWIARSHAGVLAGSAAQPPPPRRPAGQRGRLKRTPAPTLLEALTGHAARVLALLRDRRVPFTNHPAERDRRMVNVQQQISGTFRSAAGATASGRIRSDRGTMRKQSRDRLEALSAVVLCDPLLIAWGS